MASDKDVLRALAEEARAAGVHPDRESVLSEWLDAQSDDEPAESADKPPAKSPAKSPAKP